MYFRIERLEEQDRVTREITIDDDIYEALKDQAEPFEDTPSTVLRRLLDLSNTKLANTGTRANGASADDRTRRRTPRRGAKRGPRAKKGSILPETEYEIPVLRALDQMGGRAASREVVAAVGVILNGKLTETDRESIPTGGLRWENRVHFTRLRLKEAGLLAGDSPRGVWELSDKGRERLAETAS